MLFVVVAWCVLLVACYFGVCVGCFWLPVSLCVASLLFNINCSLLIVGFSFVVEHCSLFVVCCCSLFWVLLVVC